MVSTTLSLDTKSPSTADIRAAPAAATTNTAVVRSESSQSVVVNEQISLLFPKCRPRNDINLNPLNIIAASATINNIQVQSSSPPTSSLSSESSSTTKLPTSIGTNPFIDIQNVGNFSNNIITTRLGERCSHYFNNTSKIPLSESEYNISTNTTETMSKHFQKHLNHMQKSQSYHQNPFLKDSEHSYWEIRSRALNTTPATTVLNSPDITEFESNVSYQINKPSHHIKVGRSPISHPEASQNYAESMNSSRSLAVVADGEVVVFDDIGDNWQNNMRITSEQAEGIVNSAAGTVSKDKIDEETVIYTSANDQSKLFRDANKYYETSRKTNHHLDAMNPRHSSRNVSGIIDYDGSPRRFGHSQYNEEYAPHTIYNGPPSSKMLLSSPSSQFPPRPGFPQRIVQHTPSEISTLTQLNTEDTINDVSEIGTSSEFTLSEPKTSTFDYLYEFSETRKVLEEFFKCPANDDDKTLEKLSDFNGSDVDSMDIHYEFRGHLDLDKELEKSYTERMDKTPIEDQAAFSPLKQNGLSSSRIDIVESNDFDLFLDSASRSSNEMGDPDMKNNTPHRHSRCFRYSPETTDYDSNCGDLDSLSGDFNNTPNYPTFARHYTSMPVLEDGLSSGHASDTENNNPAISVLMDNKKSEIIIDSRENDLPQQITESFHTIVDSPIKRSPIAELEDVIMNMEYNRDENVLIDNRDIIVHNLNVNQIFKNTDPELESLYSINMVQLTPPPPAPAPHRKPSITGTETVTDIQAALKDIRTTLQRTKTLPAQQSEKLTISNNVISSVSTAPVWIPRCRENSGDSIESDIHPEKNNLSADEEEPDTDLETDRLLGHQRLDDHGFYDDKNWCDRKSRSLLSTSLSKLSPKIQQTKTSLLRQGLNSILPTTPEIAVPAELANNNLLDIGESVSSPEHSDKSPDKVQSSEGRDEESPNGSNSSDKADGDKKKKSKNKEVLIEGVLFRARYLGSTQLVCEGQPTKSTRMMQAEEAVSRIKSPDGESQPSTEVDLFISTEKIMVLNTDLKEIMMDHALRTISYIADIGDLVVLMARRRFVPQDVDDGPKPNRTPKMICHVFESDEAQFIAQSIGQAFQVAYMEFLKANGIEDHSFVKEMDYQEVLNSQEIFGDELEIFAKKELQKEVVVPKAKGEILGVVIVESGWGSMLPTVVIANLLSSGAAARCGQLNIGDQIIAINGLSLVGLPLSTCQTYIKNTKNQTVVKFTVVPCAPVVEVKIKRPNTKYQLGFSVQNGVICSLLRGGIAERGGVRVGHRIIEINNQSVVAVPHEKIVNLLATSVGEILMKTMPTSMFRLLTGQENPIYI